MIRIVNARTGYGKKEVLHGVSMTFQPGKITALIGPNGSGKSTLLKTVVGIQKLTSGNIFINEVPISKISAGNLAKQVAYLPQSKKTPDISVLKLVLHGRFAYLDYPRKYKQQDVEIAKKALLWAGLSEKEDEMVNRLSGGMKQQVYIAMAIAQNAGTILMDEPLTYLDAVHQIRVMELAKKLAEEGKAVVMVLHDLSLALRTADHVIVLHEGNLAGEGSPEKVYESGILQKTFGVQLERIQTKSGWHYLYI